MNLGVTIGAAAVKVESGKAIPRGTGMLRMCVTLGAKPWICDFEKPVIDRAMRLVTIGAILDNGRVLPEERTASLRMTCVTIFIDAGLFELGRIRSPVGIVAVGACHLSFPKRHVRRAHELGFSLKMALTTDFGLSALVEKGSLIANLGKLVPIGGFLHQSVAIDASDATARMRTCIPIGLNTALMTAKTRLVLPLRRLARILAECDHAADALAPSGSNMVTARAVTALASALLCFVARVKQKNFPHLRLGKFFELRRVASSTNFIADVSRRG